MFLGEGGTPGPEGYPAGETGLAPALGEERDFLLGLIWI